MEKLRETFEAVEMGTINEDEYFFELMSPCFYYTVSFMPHCFNHVYTVNKTFNTARICTCYCPERSILDLHQVCEIANRLF